MKEEYWHGQNDRCDMSRSEGREKVDLGNSWVCGWEWMRWDEAYSGVAVKKSCLQSDTVTKTVLVGSSVTWV